LRFIDRFLPRALQTAGGQEPGLLRRNVRVVERGGYFLHSDWSPSGVTDQFLLDAGTYHDRYFDRLDFLGLADQCLTAAAIDRSLPLRVLDIGSGGGSSVFALAKLLPNAKVVASDISPQLLGKLTAFSATRPELESRISAYCFDLHQPFFEENVFDFVFGSAIIHHLTDPLAALRHVASSLKPGGRIVIVEPMEAGSLLLTTMYEAVLVELRHRGAADHPIARLMVAMRTDIHARLGVPVRKPWTERLDDKWVFNRPYLSDLARGLHCRSAEVCASQSDLSHVYEESFRSLLADSGNADVEIPEYVLSVVRKFDAEISPGLKEHLCPTGIVIFTK
jgi:SAM-dependent methyltransferase